MPEVPTPSPAPEKAKRSRSPGYPSFALPEAIRKAAARQAARLKPHKEGAQAQTAARLLKEIGQAQTILLTPAKRKAYEAQLHKITAKQAATA